MAKSKGKREKEVAPGPPPAEEKSVAAVDYGRLADEICGWLEERRKAAGAGGYVVGVSGGVDSALTIALCQRTGSPTTGLILPCRSAPEDADIADSFLKEKKIAHHVITLDQPFADLLAALIEGRVFRTAPDQRMKAVANIKPRLRMIALYAYANQNDRLVVGTGNRSEDATGYFTKYGDGGVDLLPIAELYKREVRDLARHLGVPEGIVDRIPTAGLWLGQTDEGEMGVTYDRIEEYFRAFDEMREGWHGGGEAEVHEALGRRSGEFLKISGLALASAHKTSYPPVFPARERLKGS